MASPGVAVDFAQDGFDAGDELAAYVVKWRIQRGASAVIGGGSTIGTATVTLNNQPSDRFNPENSGGPLYGKLVDGLPVWIGPNSDGPLSGSSPRGLFAGRTKDWTPILVPGQPVAPTVELTCEDQLAAYARTHVTVSDAIGRAQDSLRSAMLTAGGETHTALASEIETMPLSSFDGDLLVGLEAINRANGTRHAIRPTDDRATWYAYTTRNRQWRLDGTADATLNADSQTVKGLTGLTLSADTVINRQKATVTPVDFTPSDRIVWEAQGLPWLIANGSPQTIWIEYDDFVANPTVQINYTGATTTATLTSFGKTAKLVLTATAAGTGTIASLFIRGQLARRGPDESYVADDASSQAGYRGVRAGADIGPEYVGVLVSATGIAAHVVWRYATPQLRPQLVVQNWLPYQFDIDLFDTIALTTTQGKLTSRLFEVIGLTHEGIWGASGTQRLHVATFVLQECRVQSNPHWFTPDASVLDGTDILGY